MRSAAGRNVHPILIELWGLEIPTYGLLLAASFLLALRVALHYAKREGVPLESVMNLWLWVLFSGIVGAKILLYIVDFEQYVRNPRSLLSSLRSAGVMYGGLAAGVAVGVWYVRRQALPIWKCFDLCAPPLAIGHALGRMGCLAAGCCFGRPTRLAWGVTFSDPRARAITSVPLDLPLHPTQVLLSLGSLALFAGLVALYRRKRFDGQVFAVYLAAETLLRFCIEFLRGDPRGTLLGLPTSQPLAIAGFAVALVLYWRRRRSAPAGA